MASPRPNGLRLPSDIRHLILKYRTQGHSVAKICDILVNERNFKTRRETVWRFLRHFKTTGSVAPRPHRRYTRKIKPIRKVIVGRLMQEQPDTTSKKLQEKLKNELNLDISDRTVRTLRKNLGWRTTKTRYCQLISVKNKKARIDWCLDAFARKETFHNVIFTDETTVEMCSSGRLYFHHERSAFQRISTRQPKPKHSYKVHVWGGISYRGRTHVCIFTGIMDSPIYQQILQRNLLPFTSQVFPDGYRLYQDNDSKHTSKSTKKWMQDVNMLDKVMQTPASSPDLNPIENVWGSMKYFLQTHVKPQKKDELVEGITTFWRNLKTSDCARYIDHIHKVIPVVILNNGEPSPFPERHQHFQCYFVCVFDFPV